MIKLMAMLLMVVDHVGAVFFPELRIFREIGRLSMPMFAFLIAQGYQITREHGTTKQYAINMAVLMVISQIPFMMVSGSPVLSIAASWLIAIGLLRLLERFDFGRLLEVILVLLAACMGFIDYGFLAIAMVLLFYFTKVKEDRPLSRFLITLGLIIIYVIITGASIQANMLYAIPLIDLLCWLEEKWPKLRLRIPKVIGYSFYPAHLYLLGLFRLGVLG